MRQACPVGGVPHTCTSPPMLINAPCTSVTLSRTARNARSMMNPLPRELRSARCDVNAMTRPVDASTRHAGVAISATTADNASAFGSRPFTAACFQSAVKPPTRAEYARPAARVPQRVLVEHGNQFGRRMLELSARKQLREFRTVIPAAQDSAQPFDFCKRYAFRFSAESDDGATNLKSQKCPSTLS